MNNRFFKNGNFTGLSQAILYIVGVVLVFGPMALGFRATLAVKLVCVFGMFLIFVGGFSSRAQLSGFRVFGEADWKKAKRTYKDDDKK